MFIIGDHFDSDIYRAFGFHICHITYLLISFYLYLICIFAYESNAFRFNVSRIAEWEENALLVGRKLLDNNISHIIYPHGSYPPIQVRVILPLNIIVYPIRNL